jgi:O-antigen ligase
MRELGTDPRGSGLTQSDAVRLDAQSYQDPPEKPPGSYINDLKVLQKGDRTVLNPMQGLAALMGIALILMHMANLPELIYTITGKNLRILYLVGPFAYVAVLFTGGVGRTLRSTAARWYLLSAIWLFVAVPFSFWMGASVKVAKNYTIIVVPLIFVIVGLIVTWKQLTLLFYSIVASGVVVLLNVRFFGTEKGAGERLGLTSSGMLGNSNDIASHLVLIAPFFLWIILDRQRNILTRLAFSGAFAYSILTIMRTGSRGALLALLVAGLIGFLVAPMRVRIVLLIAGLSALLLVPTAIPEKVKGRLASLFDEQTSNEALQSKEARREGFRNSIKATIKNPIFGVGPGQFANYTGVAAVQRGEFIHWQATHCAWTQVSSECGLPALGFLLAAISSMLWSVYSAYRHALRLQVEPVARTLLCFMLAVIPYLVTITFLSNAYRFYLATIIGIGVVLSLLAREEIVRTQLQQVQPIR